MKPGVEFDVSQQYVNYLRTNHEQLSERTPIKLQDILYAHLFQNAESSTLNTCPEYSLLPLIQKI